MVLFVGAIVLGAPVVRAEDIASRVQRANGLMKEGKPDEALKLYKEAAEDPSGKAGASPELAFNQGCAQLALQNASEAERLFHEALRTSPSPELRSRSSFNLGVLQGDRAEAVAKEKPEAAIESLRAGEKFFRGALEHNPTDRDAARSVELTQRRIAELQEEIERRKQQQQQQEQKSGQKPNEQKSKEKTKAGSPQQGQGDEKQGDPSESPQQPQKSPAQKLDELAKQQEQAAKESAEQSKEQPKQSETERSQKGQQQSEKQQDLREQTQEASEQLRKMAEQQQDQQSREKLNQSADQLQQAQKDQRQAEQQLKEGKPEEASKSQQEASKKLRQAQQTAQSAQAKSDDKQQSEQQEQREAEQERARDEKGEDPRAFNATAAQILDRERQQRQAIERFLRQQRGRVAPVDKDW